MNTPFDEQIMLRIEQYLRNALTPPERAAFEQTLREQPDLAALVAEEQALEALLHEELDATLPQSELASLRERIGQVDSQLEGEGFFESKTAAAPLTAVSNNRMETAAPVARRRSLTFTRMAVAASVLLLVAAGYWLFFPRVDAIGLAAQYNTPESTYLPNLRRQYGLAGMGTADADARQQLANGLTAYTNGQYTEAADLLRDYATAFPSDGSADGTRRVQMAALYLALSAMARQDFAAARDTLRPLTDDQTFDMQSTARWYFALACLQTGDPAAAKAALYPLTNTDSPYRAAATRLHSLIR